MSLTYPFPDIIGIDFNFPATPLLRKAHGFIFEHLPLATALHCVRTAYFALIIAAEHPDFKGEDLNLEAVLYSILMHDLGQSHHVELLLTDKRWEVDSADIAREFVEKRFSGKWDKPTLQLVWDSIVLHTSPSIAIHKELEVALTQRAVMIYLFGPDFPGQYVSRDQYIAVTRLIPRDGFKESLVGALCCTCERKPHTTFDNFTMEFGLTFGYDMKGRGQKEYVKMAAENSFTTLVITAMDGLLQWEKKGFPGL